MACMEEKMKQGGGLVGGDSNLLEGMKLLKEMQGHNGQSVKIPLFLCYLPMVLP